MDTAPVNLNEALVRIKKAGPNKTRAVPMPNQNVNTGLYQIEINENNSWRQIAVSIPQKTALDLIKQATNRTLLG